MAKRAPHYRTPDYPRSKVAEYVVTVMQLFDPQCEGHFVSHVEQKCSKLWEQLSKEQQTIARARVEVLHTLFADPNAKRSTIFEVLHERFDIDRFLVWYDSTKHLLDTEGPESLARAAYKAGQDDADDQLRSSHASLQKYVMEMESESEDGWRAQARRDDLKRVRSAVEATLEWLRSREDVPAEVVVRLEEALED